MDSTTGYWNELESNGQSVIGSGDHEKYFLQILGPEKIADIAVVSYRAVERMGHPYRIDIVATHPQHLARAVILGHEAKFRLVPDDGGEPVLYWGRITRFSHTKTTKDFSSYEIVLESHTGCLTPRTTQTYQNQSAPEIIDKILRRNALLGHQYAFRLRRRYPRHAFRFQYQQGDWDFINMLMQQEGIYSYITQGDHGDVVVFGDDIDHYVYQPRVTAMHRADSGLESGEQSVFALRTDTDMVPQSFVVADYNPEQAWERFRAEGNVARSDTTTFGQPYIYGTGHLDQEGAQWEAQLRHEAAFAWQVVYRGESNVHELRPGRILSTDAKLPDAPHGEVVVEVTHTGGRAQPYRNTYTAIPSNRRFRLRIEDHLWPKITGTLSARVTSPSGYKFAYLTDQGYYVVRFDCDYGEWPAGGESVPLRLAKPFAGRNHTGLHMPALDGDEALVGFQDGNPNKPILVGFAHNSQRPDLVNSSRRRMSRNEMRTQSGNKFWMDDWDNQQGIELSTEHSGRSQLNLGYIPDRDLKQRGAGAELRTSGPVVARGGAGAMLSAYDQAGGSGKVLAMEETIAQLKDMLALAESLAQAADASKASPADTHAQKSINDDLNELRKPGALVTAPGPVGVVSGDGVQLAAEGSLIATAKKGMHFSTLKRFTLAARDLVSLFSQKGMSLIAAAGAVVVQAQRGSMQLASQKDMTVETVDGVLHVKSSKEIVLNVGGSYLRMTPEGVELGSRGDVVFRTSGLKKVGPAQMDLGGAAFAPTFVSYTTECEVWRTNPGFVAAPEPAPEAGAVASSPLSDFFLARGNRDPLKTNDPDNAPKGQVGNKPGEYPKPVKLEAAAPCNWKMDNFKVDATLHRETPRYRKYHQLPTGEVVLLKDAECSGDDDTNCEFIYDSVNKILTAKVVIALVPRLLAKIDPATRRVLRNSDNKYIEVNYETFENGANSGKSFEEHGLVLVDRDLNEVNASTYKNNIENTLNQGGYKLILDACQKGAACGCRVSVKYCVDVHVVRKTDAEKLNPTRTIDLFREVDRADAAHWPELDHDYSSGRLQKKILQIKAHETGHLFNYPDEYYLEGGFVHKQYVKNDKTLDFDLGDANAAGIKTWKIESSPNLMGYGALHASATVGPYYLEYIRQWFSVYTNKIWRVGYEN